MSDITNQTTEHRPQTSGLRPPSADLRNPTPDLRAPSGSAPRLPAPVRITEQVWPEGTVPVVSICCVTYQHVNFIRDAIEGFLMQETTFPVEIIIRDDASTDGTAEIVREYQEKFPQLIRTILHSENQFSKGIKAFPETREMARGEFIALCEGDDHWISKEKLQKQVEVLEAESSIVGVFHVSNVIDEKGVFLGLLPADECKMILAFEDVVAANDRATCSMLFRVVSPGADLEWAKDLPMGDWPLQVALAVRGNWFVIPETMSAYRHHSGGIWSCRDQAYIASGVVRFYDAAIRKFGFRALRAIGKRKKEFLVFLFREAVAAGDWPNARKFLTAYLLAWPDRFSLPANQRRNTFRCLVSKVFGSRMVGKLPL